MLASDCFYRKCLHVALGLVSQALWASDSLSLSLPSTTCFCWLQFVLSAQSFSAPISFPFLSKKKKPKKTPNKNHFWKSRLLPPTLMMTMMTSQGYPCANRMTSFLSLCLCCSLLFTHSTFSRLLRHHLHQLFRSSHLWGMSYCAYKLPFSYLVSGWYEHLKSRDCSHRSRHACAPSLAGRRLRELTS